MDTPETPPARDGLGGRARSYILETASSVKANFQWGGGSTAGGGSGGGLRRRLLRAALPCALLPGLAGAANWAQVLGDQRQNTVSPGRAGFSPRWGHAAVVIDSSVGVEVLESMVVLGGDTVESLPQNREVRARAPQKEAHTHVQTLDVRSSFSAAGMPWFRVFTFPPRGAGGGARYSPHGRGFC